MRFLSFRAIYLCVLLPPLLYVFSIPALEAYLQARWTQGLRDALIPDVQALLRGHQRMEEAVELGVSQYLGSQPLVRWGARPRVIIRTEAGRILYPHYTTNSHAERHGGALFGLTLSEAQENAAYNARVMEEGIVLNLEVRVPANTWIASVVLLFSVLLSCGLLYRSYTARVREALLHDRENRLALKRTSEELSQALEGLRDLEEREALLRGQMAALQRDLMAAKARMEATEEEALAEIEALGAKLKESVSLREKMEQEVERLRTQAQQTEKAKFLGDSKAHSRAETVRKRFSALYKRLLLEPRAVEGFLALPTEMQIKAEQTIHTLDSDASLVPVRRKVFSGKGGAPVLETEFAHKGRLYWYRRPDARVVVLAIGTKNTQERDMAYLRALEP
jgi:hypothetical protein